MVFGAPPDDREKTESSDELAEELSGASADVRRSSEESESEHEMSRCNSRKCSGYLCSDVCRGLAPRDAPLPRIGKAYGWIEVCPGDGTKCEDDFETRSAEDISASCVFATCRDCRSPARRQVDALSNRAAF